MFELTWLAKQHLINVSMETEKYFENMIYSHVLYIIEVIIKLNILIL